MLLFGTLLFDCFLATCLTLFLEFCFREGNIFQGWLPFIAKTYYRVTKKKYPDLEDYVEEGVKDYDTLRDYRIGEAWITKPLGGCVVCFGFWVCLIYGLFSGLNLYGVFCLVLISNFLIRFFQNKII